MDKRKYKRLHTKLYVNIKSGLMTGQGLLCDISENGLFIKCTRDFTLGAAIDIEIFMPDNTRSLLKGIVRRKVELPDVYRKHGLGIELIEKDTAYKHFLKILDGQTKTPVQTLSTVRNKEVLS